MPVLFTIGYEGAAQRDVIAALRSAGVAELIDVRAVAASRRAGFAKGALRAGIEEAGIGYRHVRELGTPAEGRAAARAGRSDEMRRVFTAHLATPEAETALAGLAARIADGPPVCLLCLERDHRHCHRAILAERLGERVAELRVRHLLPAPAAA